MARYFCDEQGNIKESLITERARAWALSFIKPRFPNDRRREKNPPLSSSQLRRFHAEVKTISEQLKNGANDEKAFLKVRPSIKMIKSKVAYACRTADDKDRKVPEEFMKYMNEMIDNVGSADDFRAFVTCFDAVVGYFYGEGGGKRK